MNFNKLSKKLISLISPEAVLNYKKLENQKTIFAKQENYRKALEIADQLKIFKLFEFFDFEEINNCYLQFLYELEIFKHLGNPKFENLMSLELEISPEKFNRIISDLENNLFNEKKDLENILQALLLIQDDIITKICPLNKDIMNLNKLELKMSQLKLILEEFNGKITEITKLSNKFSELIFTSRKFQDYCLNIFHIHEIYQNFIPIILLMRKYLKKEEKLENINDKNIIDKFERLIVESVKSFKKHDFVPVHERVSDPILISSFFSKSDNKDKEFCGFCGLPLNQDSNKIEKFRDICQNIFE